MAQLKELHEQRSKLIAKARQMLDDSEKTGKPLDAEARKNYDAIWAEADSIKDRMTDLAKVEAEERELAKWKEPQAPKSAHEPIERPAEERTKPNTVELRGIKYEWPEGSEGHKLASDDYRNAYRGYLRGETRALQAQADAAGGYTVPAQFAADLIQAVDDLVFIRQMSTVNTLATGSSLGKPSLDNDPADSDWTSELLTGSEDSTMSFGKRDLTPHPLAKRIKVSKTLIRQSALNIESIVSERLAYKQAVTQEKAFLTGTGAQQPLGVFTASADGVTTARDVTSGASATVAADDVAGMYYNLKPQYRPSSTWIMHTDWVKAFALLKDGDGQYIWRAGYTQNDPDTLYGRPVLESRYAPNTASTGQYAAVLGDFSKYWIVDSLALTIQTLMELYAETNQVGYIMRSETDAMPVLAEAFARLKLG